MTECENGMRYLKASRSFSRELVVMEGTWEERGNVEEEWGWFWGDRCKNQEFFEVKQHLQCFKCTS